MVPLTGDAPDAMVMQGGKGWQGTAELKGEEASSGGLVVVQPPESCFPGLVPRRSWRGICREAWLSPVVVGMREDTHSLGAYSPKGVPCLLSALYGSCW